MASNPDLTSRQSGGLASLIRAITICLTALTAVSAAGCGGVSQSSAEGGADGGRLTLVAYSTPREAYEEIIPAFQETASGSGVSFDQSYGSSGEQSRAVEAGLPADHAVAAQHQGLLHRALDAIGLLEP